MKILTDFTSVIDAEQCALDFRQKGILLHVASADSVRNNLESGAFKATVWVVVDDQYNDARELLNSPDHEPGLALSEEEMVRLEQAGAEAFNRSIGNLLTGSLIFILVVTGLLVFISHKFAGY